MRNRERYDQGHLKGEVSLPSTKGSKLLVLLHGVGANETGLIEVGEMLSADSIIVSLRAPIVMGPSSFAWFHVQFTANGPVHNWDEANHSFELLEQEIQLLSQKYEVPVSNISMMGFSQGSIMTMGLVLKSSLRLESYICFSGRTLPEFENYGLEHPEIAANKKVYLAHGQFDDKLPVFLGRKSKDILEKVKANLSYHEFEGGHQILVDVINDVSKWMN